ncbi:MAG: hypothetical protein GXO92_02165, partial [FCB group bacterium]|nr:hypothetical protein [FCB group bacterium]
MASPDSRHPAFKLGFIWTALLIALLGGFAMGAHVAYIVGFGYLPGKSYYVLIQTHGHLQLLGWTGLFIIGMSLYFFPRMSHSPVGAGKQNLILGLLGTGLVLRFVIHNIIPYVILTAWFKPLNWVLFLSGIMEWLGVMIYVVALLKSMLNQAGGARLKLKKIRPLLVMTFAGWIIYTTVQVILLFRMARGGEIVLDSYQNTLSVTAFVYLVLLPVCFAVSIRTFPLYLRLPAVHWPIPVFAGIYFVSVVLQLSWFFQPLVFTGIILKNILILWFVWKLDIFTRFKRPWTFFRKVPPVVHRKTTRDKYPDYGEWGRFELLIYSAYFWLTVGAILELTVGISAVINESIYISADAIRHLVVLGFVSLLIFGMAPRMIPGFIHVKKIAYPGLVT